MKLGGHVVVAEKLRDAAVTARALGYDLVQLGFARNLDWTAPTITEDGADEWRSATYGMDTYIHLPYTLNPCEIDERKNRFYRHVYRRWITFARALGTKGVVIHPGFRKESTVEAAQHQLQRFFEQAHADDDREDPKVLIETDSGSKNDSAVGTPLFIASALDKMAEPRFAMCLDTEHLWARGVDLWNPATRELYKNEFGGLVGLVHLNVPDPGVELGSHRDRHNSPFSSFEKDSDGLIATMAELGPLVLERRSLTIQEEDAATVRRVMAEGGSPPRDGYERAEGRKPLCRTGCSTPKR